MGLDYSTITVGVKGSAQACDKYNSGYILAWKR